MRRLVLAAAVIAVAASGCAPAADQGRMGGCHWQGDSSQAVCPVQ